MENKVENPPLIFVSLGSNIQKEYHIRHGISALKKCFSVPIISSVYQTKAVGFTGTTFYNLVVKLESCDAIEYITRKLKEIEWENGRGSNTKSFSNRTLDIDLLMYGSLVQHDGVIDVPRKDILLYDFVLKPLAEIASTVKHPENHETFSKLWEKFEGESAIISKVNLSFSKK